MAQTTSRTESSNPSISVLHLENMVVRNQVSFGIGRMDDSTLDTANQDDSQTPNNSSTGCYSGILTFILNIPKEIVNLLAHIVGYLSSFCCKAKATIDIDAAQAFVNARYEGIPGEQAQAFIDGFNALPQEVKEFVHAISIGNICWQARKWDLFTGKYENVDPTSAEALGIIQHYIMSNHVLIRLMIQCWILEKERPKDATFSSEQDPLAAARTFIDTPFIDRAAFIQAFNALPQVLKEYVNMGAIIEIAGARSMNFAVDNLKEGLYQNISPNDPETATLIQNQILAEPAMIKITIKHWIYEKTACCSGSTSRCFNYIVIKIVIRSIYHDNHFQLRE